MEYLPNGLTLDICPGAFPLSTDSMALADIVRLPRGAKVLDIGSGCGTLGLLLCAKDPSCHITGIEISSPAHEAALVNIRRNGLEGRMVSRHADARQLRELVAPGSFSVCVSNPPYFSGGPASRLHADARREDLLDPGHLMRGAAWALKTGGDLFLVHRPERLAQLIALGAKEGLETKRLRLVKHRHDKEPALVLLQLRKGGRPGLILEEEALYREDGSPTAYYHQIYHTEEA